MANIEYAMMLSLDGYIAGREGGPVLPMPDEALHQHFNDRQKASACSLYGRRLYEVMRYWETPEAVDGTPPVEQEFAHAWRDTPKVVFSTTLHEVGPNATLVKDDVEGTVRALKEKHAGTIDVGGAGLAASLSRLGLIDEYRLYFLPVVLGGGTPFFASNSALELEPLGTERLSQGVLLARYRLRAVP